MGQGGRSVVSLGLPRGRDVEDAVRALAPVGERCLAPRHLSPSFGDAQERRPGSVS